MKVKAHAKINLALDVVNRREDGYHDLEMVMVPLTLCDEIEITISDQTIIEVVNGDIPKENTVSKAIQLMKDSYNIEESFYVRIEKHIPMEAGLAGGSADAAAVIKAINELCHLHRPLDELAELSVQIGADVPFCIYNRPSIVKGIGEQITPIQLNCPFEILLVKPDQGVSTPKAFQTLHLDECDHTDVEKLKQALESNSYEEALTYMKNSLEESALRLVPEIQSIKEELMSLGFDHCLMSGSGSTVFAITRNKEFVEKAIHKFKYNFVVMTNIDKN